MHLCYSQDFNYESVNTVLGAKNTVGNVSKNTTELTNQDHTLIQSKDITHISIHSKLEKKIFTMKSQAMKELSNTSITTKTTQKNGDAHESNGSNMTTDISGAADICQKSRK